MASKTPSTNSISEAKEPALYKLDEKASTAYGEEKAVDSEDASAKEFWNNPSVNIYRLCSCFILFFAGSLFFSAYGVVLPQFEKDYHQSHATVSLVFVGVLVGAVLAASAANITHMSLGRRGAGIIGSLCMGLGNLILALHPPWPAVPVTMCLITYGIAGLDPVASAWVGGLHHASGFLGMLQGCFSIGSAISPLIANAMIQRGIPYYRFYHVPFALSMLGGIGFTFSFWSEDGAKYARDTRSSHNSGADHTKEILRNKVSWILALFVLVSWGVETVIGSWMVIYLTDGRGGSLSNASLVNSMFWLSFTIGRFLLVWIDGAVPRKWRGKGPVSLFIVLSIVLELMFWLLPTFAGSSVAACLLAFFCGPLYPLILKMLTILLPPHLHVSAIGIGSALGALGSSVFPIAAGAIAESRGITMIHPLILGIYVTELILWYLVPSPSSQNTGA
ncbi:major facilitator superfamily domain-containing protein [Tuber brumale]|nr:major facilitator superfamily domain-containing protein [Tuber brumale]